MATNCPNCGYTNTYEYFKKCPECGTDEFIEVKPAVKMRVGETGYLHKSSKIDKYLNGFNFLSVPIHIIDIKNDKYHVEYGAIYDNVDSKHPYNKILDEWVDNEWVTSHMVTHYNYNNCQDVRYRFYDYINHTWGEIKEHKNRSNIKEFENTPIEIYRFSDLDDDTKAYVYSGKAFLLDLIPGTPIRMIKNNYGRSESEVSYNGSIRKEYDGYLDNILVTLTPSGIFNSNYKLIDKPLVNGKPKELRPMLDVYLEEDWKTEMQIGISYLNIPNLYSSEGKSIADKLSKGLSLLEEAGVIEHKSSGCGNSIYKFKKGWLDIGLTGKNGEFEQFEFGVRDSKHSRKPIKGLFWSAIR